jgi:hypothetical protein
VTKIQKFDNRKTRSTYSATCGAAIKNAFRLILMA